MNFKLTGRGCVPNLQGASPVGRVRGGNSYAAQIISINRPDHRRRDHGEFLSVHVAYPRSKW